MSGTSLNPNIDGMRCLSCNKLHPLADYFEGCPACFAAGTTSSVAPSYSSLPATVSQENLSDWLVYRAGSVLGEGNTPLVAVPPLATGPDVSQVLIKSEASNPTGSHKDRMSALLVQRALDVGAETVVAASSGNAGASLAAYSANAALKCVIVTTPTISPNWRRAIEMHGAALIATQTAKERWEIVANRVRAGEWYPATNYLTPPVGSNPWAVDGYRAVALEIFIQTGNSRPTDILVPTSRADILWGIAKGFVDLVTAGLLTRCPRVHAVEPFPRIERVLQGQDLGSVFPGSSKMVSIGGDSVTFQALDALNLCGGTAVAVAEQDALEDQRWLARRGFYLELSSAAALSGLRRLRERGAIGQNAHVVLVATSHGYKEPAAYDRSPPIVDAATANQ
jgi:threonine synthase